MTDLDTLLAANPPAAETARTTRTAKHRHVYDVDLFGGDPMTCACGAIQDPARSRRGKSSLRAGKDAERAIAKAYGGNRVGQYGGIEDVVVGDLFVVQSKAGGWFTERYWSELAKLPRAGGRIPTLVVSDRPGPGRKTRRMVIRTLEDDVALHGEKP